MQSFPAVDKSSVNMKQQSQHKNNNNNVESPKPAVVEWVSPLPLSTISLSSNIDVDDIDMVPATTAVTVAYHDGKDRSSSGSTPSNGKNANSPRAASPPIPNYGALSTHHQTSLHVKLDTFPIRSSAPATGRHQPTLTMETQVVPKSRTRNHLKHILVIAACCVVVFPLLWVMALVGPSKSGIDCDRQSDIRRPHRETLTPTLGFTIITSVVAIILLVATEFFMCHRSRSENPRMRFSLCSKWQWPSWIYFAARNLVAYAFGVHMTQGAVFLIRMMVAIPRPDWWSVCQPIFPGGNCPAHQYTTNYECRNKNTQQIWDASRSFPSGHVTFITFNAVFILIFLERRCRIPRLKYDSVRYFLRTIEFWLFIAVFFTSAERVQANSHHPSDVYAGAIFGIVGAIFASTLLLYAPDCHEQQQKQLDQQNLNQITHRPHNRGVVNGGVDVDSERGNASRNSVISTVAH